VTDGQTDGQTELRWLRRAIAVPAVARKNCFVERLSLSFIMQLFVYKGFIAYCNPSDRVSFGSVGLFRAYSVV